MLQEVTEPQKSKPEVIHWVYMLRCKKNNALYVGLTNNIKRRLGEHKSGVGGRYTRAFGPVELVYYEQVPSIYAAYKRERELKLTAKYTKEQMVKDFTGDLEEFR